MRYAALPPAVTLLLWLGACGGGSGPAGPTPTPTPQPQALLSATGLYANITTQQVDPRNRPFAPQYVLWSDGSAKRRWIFLPGGTQIDTSDMNRWSFPMGTKIWKEFAFQGRRVETRLMEKTVALTGVGAWSFRTFQWRSDGSDAVQAPAEGVRDVAPTDFGTAHDLPSVAQCVACHDRGGDAVLGFSSLQLSDDQDPLTVPRPVDAVTLNGLIAQGLLTRAPSSQPRIAASNPTARAALGYLHANCSNCHNPTGRAGYVAMNLFHVEGTRSERDEPAYASTVNRLTSVFVIPGLSAAESFLIRPGAPERSAVVVRMRSRGNLNAMPPIGSEAEDSEGIGIVTEWVRRLR